MGPTWGPSGAHRTQMGLMLAPWILLSGIVTITRLSYMGAQFNIRDVSVHSKHGCLSYPVTSLIARFMGPTWGPSGAHRTQMGLMLAPWILLSGIVTITRLSYMGAKFNIRDVSVHSKHGCLPYPVTSLIARFMGPTWGPSGAHRTQVGLMLAPWILLSGIVTITRLSYMGAKFNIRDVSVHSKHGCLPYPVTSLIARFMGPTWGPSGAHRTQVGLMLAPWILLSGIVTITRLSYMGAQFNIRDVSVHSKHGCLPYPVTSLIARFMGPTWGPSGAHRTQVGLMLAPWILLSGIVCCLSLLGFGHA